MDRRKSGVIGYVFIVFFISGLGVFLFDLLFSKPDHLQGTIVEKIFIPSHSGAGATPYGGVKRANYFITAQVEEQWVAIVRTENGDTLKVHCHPTHYKTREVGDVIHFKKYQGKLLHIEYFAHNEQED